MTAYDILHTTAFLWASNMASSRKAKAEGDEDTAWVMRFGARQLVSVLKIHWPRCNEVERQQLRRVMRDELRRKRK